MNNLCTVEPHLSGLFTYPDTCLGTNLHSSTENDSFIRKFSYPDSQSGNRGVRISEAPLYINLITYFPHKLNHVHCKSLSTFTSTKCKASKSNQISVAT